MVTQEARREILDLVAAGKIDAAEAAAMLSGKESPAAGDVAAEAPAAEAPAAEAPAAEAPAAEAPAAEKKAAATPNSAPSWLKVRVSDMQSGKSRVRVNIPLRIVRVGMRLGAGFVPESEHVDWRQLEQLIDEGGVGMLVDVQDETSGEHIEVYVE
jgi:hypothetical protein